MSRNHYRKVCKKIGVGGVKCYCCLAHLCNRKDTLRIAAKTARLYFKAEARVQLWEIESD
jgi:hypothetical protein